MKLFQYMRYFAKLSLLIGGTSAVAFSIKHLWNKFLPPKNGSFASVPIGPFRFYFTSIDFFVGLFTEIFFKETYYLDATLEPLQAIDCGANIGVSLLYIKLRAPNARVLCFEPNPAARTVLEKNIAANGWNKNVSVLPYALGKQKGQTEFYVDAKEATTSGGSTAAHKKNKNQELNSYPVEVEPLSQYLHKPVDLLKIDIEGGELDVLEEAKDSLGLVQSVQLEYHYIPGFFTRPLSDVLTLLQNAGFHTYVESNIPPHKVIGKESWHTYMVFAWR
jgi:FkbM family methyltransferase